MTLTTLVALRGPIDADTAFVLALQALLTAGGQENRFAAVRTRTENHNGFRTLHTVRDQGLAGITTAEANEVGTQLDLAAHLDSPLPGWDLIEQTCSTLVSWDTGLGYRGRTWGNAEHLHAAAIVLLHDTLPADVELRWHNEYADTWHFACLGLRKLMRSALPSVEIATHIRNTHPKEARS